MPWITMPFATGMACGGLLSVAGYLVARLARRDRAADLARSEITAPPLLPPRHVRSSHLARAATPA